jgi:hypothetical protein
VDITLTVVLNPATHALATDKQARRLKRGDIVAVDLTTSVESPSGRLGHIHITGVPNRPLDFVRQKLTESLYTLEPYTDTIDETRYMRWLVRGHWPLFDIFPNVVNNGDGTYTATGERQMPARKAKWRIPASILPVNIRNTLLTNREITVTWEQAKPFIRKKVVANRLNATQDDETTELADGDIF